jgi:hypothetical protein
MGGEPVSMGVGGRPGSLYRGYSPGRAEQPGPRYRSCRAWGARHPGSLAQSPPWQLYHPGWGLAATASPSSARRWPPLYPLLCWLWAPQEASRREILGHALHWPPAFLKHQ